MGESDACIQNRFHEDNLRLLKAFRPIDDTFMRCLFRDNLPLATTRHRDTWHRVCCGNDGQGRQTHCRHRIRNQKPLARRTPHCRTG